MHLKNVYCICFDRIDDSRKQVTLTNPLLSTVALNEENTLNFYHQSGWFMRMFPPVGFTNDAFLSRFGRVCQGGMVAPSRMDNTLRGKQGLLVLSAWEQSCTVREACRCLRVSAGLCLLLVGCALGGIPGHH